MRADRQSLQAVQGDSGGRGRARAEAIHPHPLLLPALQGDREEEGLCWKHPCSISKNLQIRDNSLIVNHNIDRDVSAVRAPFEQEGSGPQRQ